MHPMQEQYLTLLFSLQGKYTILDMGPIDDEVVVAICALILVAVSLHYHIKVSLRWHYIVCFDGWTNTFQADSPTSHCIP